MDSEVIVRQLSGRYAVRSTKLRLIYEQCVQLMQQFTECNVTHVPRSANSEADALANVAIQDDYADVTHFLEHHTRPTVSHTSTFAIVDNSSSDDSDEYYQM